MSAGNTCADVPHWTACQWHKAASADAVELRAQLLYGATQSPPSLGPTWVASLRVIRGPKSHQCIHQKKGERCTVNGERSAGGPPCVGSFLPALSAGHSRRDLGLLHGAAKGGMA